MFYCVERKKELTILKPLKKSIYISNRKDYKVNLITGEIYKYNQSCVIKKNSGDINLKRKKKDLYNKYNRYILNNDFNQFVTITRDRNKYPNIDTFIKSVKLYLKRNNLKYIAVIEKRNQEHAHFHIIGKDLFTKNLYQRELKDYFTNTIHLYSTSPVLEKWGLSTIDSIDINDIDNYINTSKYILKYIFKDFENNEFFNSRGLNDYLKNYYNDNDIESIRSFKLNAFNHSIININDFKEILKKCIK